MACQKKTDTTSNPPKKCGSADTTSPIPAVGLARCPNELMLTLSSATMTMMLPPPTPRLCLMLIGKRTSHEGLMNTLTSITSSFLIQRRLRFHKGGEGLVKKVAKVPKNAVYALITKAVFTVDADSTIQEDYMVNPAKHGPTVNNFFIQLRKQYHEANTKIRCTGAGLEYSQIREGSNI
ncbi:hypothetical protein C8J56DRAFT_1061383 [Mycena floridula]|nr:hypothetical protein C8J56DRAFT_1061383 [Mycena floridula]